MLVCLAGGLAFCTGLEAMTTAQAPDPPYQGIVERNVFGLKPPPPPPDPEANKPPPPKIILTGILSGSVFGGKRALMKTPPAPVKPGEKPKGEQYYILNEGQREGDIEVLDIDDKAGSVKVNNSGTVVTLTLEKDGQKLPSTPAPPMPQGIPTPTGIMPPPMTMPNGTKLGAFNMPTRTLRSSFASPTGMGTPAGVGGASVVSVGGLGYTPGQGRTQVMDPGPQLSPEEYAAMLEVERARAAADVQAGKSPPLPTTAFTPPNAQLPPAQNPVLPRPQ